MSSLYDTENLRAAWATAATSRYTGSNIFFQSFWDYNEFLMMVCRRILREKATQVEIDLTVPPKKPSTFSFSNKNFFAWKKFVSNLFYMKNLQQPANW